MWHACVSPICRYLSKLALLSCHSLRPCSVWCLSVRILEALLDPLARAWFAIWKQRQQTRIPELHRHRDQWPWLQWGLSRSAYSLSRVLHEDQPHLSWYSIRCSGRIEGELRTQHANAASDHWTNLFCSVSNSSFSLILMNAGTAKRTQLGYAVHWSTKNAPSTCQPRKHTEVLLEVHKLLRLKGQDHNAPPLFYQKLPHLHFCLRCQRTQSTTLLKEPRHQNSLHLACRAC